MLNKKRIQTAIILSSAILLGGCFNMNEEESPKKPNEESKAKEGMNAYEKENFIPIQEYTGEGFELRDAKKETGEIANEHRAEVEKAVKDYFKKEYKTVVKIHNIVSAKDGVSVFVESIEAPHFYTFAIVPVDIKNREVETDRIFTQEGQVETAIKSGLYAFAYKEKFENLDEMLKSFIEVYPIIGTPRKAIENANSNGYGTTEYYLNVTGKTFEKTYDLYIKNSKIKSEQFKQLFESDGIDPERVHFTIYLYMEKKGQEPDKKTFSEIVNRIENQNNLPAGAYTVLLNDNYIDKRRAIGKKDNTLISRRPEGIIIGN